MNQAEILLLLVKIWGGIGACVALVFLTFGIDRIDEDARGAYIFRPLLIFGVITIWPLVLWRWYILADGKDEWSSRYRPRRQSHQVFAFMMPVAIVAIVLTGLSLRQTWPVDAEPVRLSPPPEASQ